MLLFLNRKKIASLTDERIKIMNEVISGMRVIKMYTWEDSFAELVADVRGYVYQHFLCRNTI